MFSIDMIVKNTPVSLSVQRKSVEDAEAVYQQVLEAMRNSQPQILELTCEKNTEKKVAVLSSEISGVVISQKSGSASTGRAPGFVSMTLAE
ncbi:MAG: hypothetical protein JGK24_28240 [Microcoleus sp. PH2017_29_MFU_D_A]|jgi:hypothetical protein|uniref:hypothetical protein n=1 Tax=unclassified Microcoleus TaxID=2642155 RepID=UPI001DB1D545|nr:MULTISPECIES: hypothetical protein [unclassified Microcoleus]MCC3421460.1 hypothetical protein [Microcoleus sp. PH2017_07_MST_O_A]MCC3433509.1 hypothetical protein [Microcoleus sp. PH2017_04_SCI_O_A]MCC3445613.1 hypothetical protein [Microcoleus sp. PH2017_03_ELD_O_A]MCC3470032.1 hypothetical protein [Microcoleus sp. PH2017_06_SFM_O_A]MCC3505900.1 hypothetical protein [Microcoleus sp. PH2017_19_SFW_U_A]MCC3513644.1 hypothetical protein [Microcoleus sp. PH2017_17_BER_D_A]TAE12282.1 MAG: hy